MNYDTIKSNYDRKLWGKPMVAICVNKGLISPAQFYQITGDAVMTKQWVVKGVITPAEYTEITGLQYE